MGSLSGWSFILLSCLCLPIAIWDLQTCLRLIRARNLRVVSNRGLLTMIIFLLGMLVYSMVSTFDNVIAMSCSEYWLAYSASQTAVFSAYLYRVWNLFALHRIASQALAHALETEYQELTQSLWFLLHRDYIISRKAAMITVTTMIAIGMLPTIIYFGINRSSNSTAEYLSEACDKAFFPIMGSLTATALIIVCIALRLFRKLQYTENFGIKQELCSYAFVGVISLSSFILLTVFTTIVTDNDVLDFFGRIMLPLTLVTILYNLNQYVFHGVGNSVEISHISATKPRLKSPTSSSNHAMPDFQEFAPFQNLERTSDMRQRTSDIRYMLEDERGFDVLTELAISEFTVESVLFLKAVVELENVSSELYIQECLRIERMFILESSPLTINLSYSTRISIIEAVAKVNAGDLGPSDRIFDGAYNDIVKMFAFETWLRISKRQQFKAYVNSLTINDASVVEEV